MPLPNPDYLTNEYFNWNGDQFPAVQLTTSSSATGSKRLLRWDGLDSIDRRRVHDLIEGYATRNTIALESAWVSGFLNWYGYHVVNYGGSIVGGNNAGMIEGMDYYASVVHNGVEVPIHLVGSASADWTTVVASVSAALAAQPGATDATVFINGDGNLEFQSNAKGAGQIIELYDGNLFRSLSGFSHYEEVRVGVTTIEDVFDLNIRDSSNNQDYTELLIGHLRVIPNQAPRSARNANDIYFNHGSAAWLYLHDDDPVV